MRELHSIEAEQSVVGGLMIDPKRFDDISDMITSDKFADLGCQVVWDAIDRLSGMGRPIDLVTMDDYLEQKNKSLYLSIGGFEFLADLSSNVPSTANIRQYAQIVVDYSRERSLYAAANEIQQILMREGLNTDERFQEAEAVFTGMDSGDAAEGGVSIKQAMREYVSFMEWRHDNPGIHGILTGIKTIDERLQGLKAGELYIIAARPAMGKTTYALNIASNAAEKGAQVYISSLEMPRKQLVQRMMAYIGGFTLNSLKTAGVLSDPETSRKVTPVASRIINMGVTIDDQAALDINELRSRCRRVKRKSGLDLVVIDYLQLLTDRSANQRFEEISSISRKLKGLAKELDCAVIALSQLSRKCDERSNSRPVLSDLRESGQIEQDADVIQFIYRDEIYNEKTDQKGIAEIITGKFRDGETGTDYLAFVGAESSFKALSYVPQIQEAPAHSKRGFE